MFNKFSIEKRLPLTMVVMVAVTIGSLCVASYMIASNVIVHNAREKLSSIGETKVGQIKDLLEKIDAGLASQAKDPTVAQAIEGFTQSFASIATPREVLQRTYIDENPFPAGEKDKLDAAPGNSPYDRLHRRYHPLFTTLKNTMNYYDIFLLDTSGNLIYSVFKEADFATNMNTGEWRESGLAEVFRLANTSSADDDASFVDFAPYAPSFDAPAAFIARPVFSEDGSRLGVIAYQMPISEFNAIGSTVIGTTGSTFIVGADGLMRTDSSRTKVDDILTTTVASPAVQRGIAGEKGEMSYQNHQNELVQGHFEPINFHGVEWIVITEQNADELFASLNDVLRVQLLAAAAFLIIATLVAIIMSRSISRPLKRVSGAVAEVASRNFDLEVPDKDRTDEIGEIALALDDFRVSLADAERQAVDAAFKSSAFEATGGPMLLTDLDFKIVGSNRAFVRLVKENASDFNVEPEDISLDHLLGRDLSEINFLPDEVKEMMRDYSKLVIKKKLLIGRSYVGLLVDVVKDLHGNPLGYVLDLKNQTFQMASQVLVQAIDGQQARLELDDDRKIKSANDRFADIVGSPPDALVGMDGERFFQFEDLADGQDIWQDALDREGTPGRFRLSGETGDRVLEGSFNPVPNQHGETTGFLLLGTDVTEARAEIDAAELRAAEKAAEQARVVETLSVGLKKLSDGDLTVCIDESFSDEYEQLRHDFNSAMTNLQSAVSFVVQNANTIGVEADSITSSVIELSKRTESQAATLEETAAAMHELTTSVASSAKGAENAATIAGEARQNAQSSGAIVEEAAEAMSEIENSSSEVSKIIGVIDDIAFQTNLLALNAGVEAARAGNAGRGFAVVASEVRALAQRCLEASNDITSLISSSGEHVKRGVELVGKTGSALESIAASVLEISDNVSQIAQATGEQSNGLGEINEALGQLDQATQHNAAMAEETSAAAKSLSDEAKQLTETTGQFATSASERPRTMSSSQAA